MRYEQAAEERAEGGATGVSGSDGGVGAAAIQFREMLRDDLAVGRIGDGFSDAEKQAHQYQEQETVREAGADGGGGPEENSQRDQPIYVEAVNEPAGDDLERGVGVEKSGEQDAELRGGKGEIVFYQGCGYRKSAAVDVVDEYGEAEECGDARELGADFPLVRGG